MIDVLIIDDDQHKIKNLRNFFNRISEVSSLDICVDLINAQRYLSKKHYDLLILDLNIPERVGDDPSPENGINFIQTLKKSDRLIKPTNIIGLSEFDDYIDKYGKAFHEDLWALIKYSHSENSWEILIEAKIKYLVGAKRDLRNSQNNSYQYDLAIATALRDPELNSILQLNGNWRPLKIANDSTQYYTGIFEKGEKKVRVVAAAATQMGMVASSVLAMKLIYNFRPRHLVITGIAAGIKGSSNLGDVLVADLSFDSGSGKNTKNEGKPSFQPDYRMIPIEADLLEEFSVCKSNRDFLDEIKQTWKADKPKTDIEIHIGPFATGSAVIENNEIIMDIKGHSRKLIGIDMEAYGVFYAAKNCAKPRPLSVFSIKSVCDFADLEKSDNFQKYAAYTSSTFLYNFVLNKMNFSLE